MPVDRRSHGGRSLKLFGAFTLIELLVAIAIIALLLALAIPAMVGARRSARGTICQTRMKQYATSMAAYSGDNKNLLPAFTWKAKTTYTPYYPDLNDKNAPYPQDAHANQSVALIRKLKGYTAPAFNEKTPNTPLVDRNFTHLVLISGGYYSFSPSDPSLICPEDKFAAEWQRTSPDAMGAKLLEQGRTSADLAAMPSGFIKFLPYWSTYQLVAVAWSADKGPLALKQNFDNYDKYTIYLNIDRFDQRRQDEVFFPSQKVLGFDLFDRHYSKRTLFHAYEEAKQPLMFADGSVTIRRTGDANPGWSPDLPNIVMPTTYRYEPNRWDPPTRSGSFRDDVKGYYRWTRGGLRGVDFGGKEAELPKQP
ncbi:MAG: prepilin-type N-terminal cleavage/methylation domain-containing protein [Phycisphaerales bacterium]|nr:prepilin-type N-terminal cleavage/methylation domain-containing protein [Phycisphaerales bacterium]